MKTMIQFLMVMFLAMSFGCANTPKGKAIQLVVASDAAADEIANGYEKFVEVKVVECDEKLDPEVNNKEDVEDCLGLADEIQGERLKKMLEILVVAQLAVKIAVECESNPLKVPKEFKAKCVDGQAADWKALAVALTSAWSDLAPFFDAVRGFAGGR